MKQAAFEQQVLALWVGSRVPINLVNLQIYTGVARAQIERWLDRMVSDGTLELDSDESGEMMWIAPGAARSKDGLRTIAEVQRLDALRASVPNPPKTSALVRTAARALTVPSAPSGKKSLIASGALSFFLGPLGWLYAAPLRESLPAIAVFLAAFAIIPHMLLMPMLALFAPLSALFGVLYAWQHNLSGDRTSLREVVKRRLT